MGLCDGDGAGDTVGEADGDGDPAGGENVPEGDDDRAEGDGFGFGRTEDGVGAGSTGKNARARCAGNSEPIGRPGGRAGLAEAVGDDAAADPRSAEEGDAPRLGGDGSGACAK